MENYRSRSKKTKGKRMKKYFRFIKERFPIIGVFLYASSMYWASYSFPNLFSNILKIDYKDSILGIVFYVLIFLHLRLFDEHKDYEKDKLAYPERMLSRGEITLNDLKILLFPVLILEGLIALSIGMMQLFIWLIILLWTFLMLKEFYISDYLNKRIGMYLITHQFLVPLMLLFPISQRIEKYTILSNYTTIIILFCITVMCFTITYEIARKTWSDDRENIHADSYTRSWGKFKTVIVTITLAFIGSTIISIIMYDNNISINYIITNYLLLLILVVIELIFLRKSTKQISKLVELTGAIFMLGSFINTSIAFTLFIK